MVEQSKAQDSAALNVVAFKPTIVGMPDTRRKSCTQWIRAWSNFSLLSPTWNHPFGTVLPDQSVAIA